VKAKRFLTLLSVIVILLLILVAINVCITNVTKVRVARSVSQTPQITQISLITPTPEVVLAKVIRVVDGDTIDVIEVGQKDEGPERIRRIRYIGINTPEIESSECFAAEASEVNKNLVLGKTVRLEKDVSEVDKYDRILRYVYVDDILVDDYLVINGFAKVMTVPPDVKYKNEFLKSENYAKENKLGLWGKCF
jgi:micrococcal nuclease